MTRIFLRVALYALVLWAVGFAVFMLTLPRDMANTNTQTADGIVVLTGGTGRIAAGVAALEAGQGDRMLVSGVNRDLDETTLYAAITDNPALVACCIDLGFEAENTVGNANEAITWAEEQGFTSLLVVSSRLHMRRTLLAFAATESPVRIRPLPVEGEDSLSQAAMEYSKYIVALARGVIGL